MGESRRLSKFAQTKIIKSKNSGVHLCGRGGNAPVFILRERRTQNTTGKFENRGLSIAEIEGLLSDLNDMVRAWKT